MPEPATTAALIMGGAQLVSGLLTNRANARQAQNQMQFQERMSNTAMQRSMADMSAAGINPLYGLSGGGAQVPGGASATMVDPLQSAVSSALSMRMHQAAFRKQQAETEIAERANAADAVLKSPVLGVRSPQFDADFRKALQEKWLEELRTPGVNNRATNARAVLDAFSASRSDFQSQLWKIGSELMGGFGINAGNVRDIISRIKQ